MTRTRLSRTLDLSGKSNSSSTQDAASSTHSTAPDHTDFSRAFCRHSLAGPLFAARGYHNVFHQIKPFSPQSKVLACPHGMGPFLFASMENSGCLHVRKRCLCKMDEAISLLTCELRTAISTRGWCMHTEYQCVVNDQACERYWRKSR